MPTSTACMSLPAAEIVVVFGHDWSYRVKSKVKVKQPYLMSITRNSNSTDKPEVDGALILLPSRHPCSVLWVFKAT